jgi:SAM-dependent MidA family methyltransferase
MRFRQAMDRALYGPDGFFRRPGPGPAGHFRTSVHASPLFAEALAVVVTRLDAALGEPDPLDLVDVGAGRGELLTGLVAALPPAITKRVRATGVELAPRPADLSPDIAWTPDLPTGIVGLLVATEWLDNVPLDIVEVGRDGSVRYLDELLQPAEPIEPADAAWLARWWPLDPAATGARAEIGAPRDAAWQAAAGAVSRGLALAVDYGHVAGQRPLFGSLTGFRSGREVDPVTDGSCDLTCAVAVDSLAQVVPMRQRKVLKALGVDGGRPPIALATSDPGGYVRALARAGAAAELTEADGLGGHWWLFRWV